MMSMYGKHDGSVNLESGTTKFRGYLCVRRSAFEEPITSISLVEASALSPKDERVSESCKGLKLDFTEYGKKHTIVVRRGEKKPPINALAFTSKGQFNPGFKNVVTKPILKDSKLVKVLSYRSGYPSYVPPPHFVNMLKEPPIAFVFSAMKGKRRKD